MIYNSTLNNYEKMCDSCTIYKLLLVIFFIMSISISSQFIYFHRYLKKYNTDAYTNTNINTGVKTETLIY